MLLSVSNSYGQVWKWAEQGLGVNIDGDDHGNDIVTDSNGNSYVTGYFEDTITFGAFTLITPTATIQQSDFDIFITKYDPNGNVLWAKQAGGIGWDEGYGISIDNYGNCYVTGAFTDTAYFESDTVYSNNTSDVFIAKYSTNGNFQWVKQINGSTGYNQGQSITNDIFGNIYVTGEFLDTLTIDAFVLNGGKIFIAKFDSIGNAIWVNQMGKNNWSPPSPTVSGIGIDENSNSYITGYFADTLFFSTDTLIASGITDIFIAKYDSLGNIQWAKKAGGATNFYDTSSDIVVSGKGSLYIVGSFNGVAIFDSVSITSSGFTDIFVSKWSKDGDIIWAKKAGGVNDDFGWGIELSFDGNLYVTGRFADSSFFDTISLFSQNSIDLYVANYDTLGNVKYAVQSAGSSASDWFGGFSISSDNFGNVYLTGIFQGSAMFGSIPITSTGYDDILVAKIGPLGNAIQDLIKFKDYKIYPNPTSQRATLEFNNSRQESHTLTLYDTQGRIIKKMINIKTDKVTIEKENFPSGLYFFQLFNGNQVIFTGKLIIK